MRALIFELWPESLELEGLLAALNRQIEAVRARHGIAAPTIASVEPELPIEVKQALHGITREALWNTVKHARARRVDVRLEPDGGSVVLEIADDGVGFDSCLRRVPRAPNRSGTPCPGLPGLGGSHHEPHCPPGAAPGCEEFPAAGVREREPRAPLIA
jgi:signal transduction histidine kinase